MRDIWVISDTHFFHSNVLTFRDGNSKKLIRPDFDDVDQMNECMVERWNSVVKDGDIVYHLGDLAFGDDGRLGALMGRLRGSKRLIVGNHDNIKRIAQQGFFKKIQFWRMFTEYGLMLSHVPLHPSGLLRPPKDGGVWPDDCETLVNVHGHIHQNPSPPGPYISACVEVRNYTPVHIEDLQQEAIALLKKIKES